MDACMCALNEGVINECAARKLPLQHLFFAIAMYVKYVDKKRHQECCILARGAVKKNPRTRTPVFEFRLEIPPAQMASMLDAAQNRPRSLESTISRVLIIAWGRVVRFMYIFN